MGLRADLWTHRGELHTCRTCLWFAEKHAINVTRHAGTPGRCRRHAPTLSGYPVVFPGDWCGDHKLDETTVPKRA